MKVSFTPFWLRKDAPTAGDVHISTTSGGKIKKPKKPKMTDGAISQEATLPITNLDAAAQQVEPEKNPKVGKGARVLKPNADDEGETALSPFPYDPNALASIRHDQTPRFFGALTDSSKLPTKRMKLSDLTAMQNRVDPKKVESMADAKNTKPPVVVSMNNRHYIADGHHRATRAWLDGEDEIDVKHKDLEPESNALKREPDWSIPFKVSKVDEDQHLIFGWASVVEQDGHLVIDKQGDIIMPEDLEKAAYNFVLYARKHGEMHDRIGTGELVESMVFTKEKQAALGIDLKKVGWWTGFKVHDAETWAAHKRGEFPDFSIGGSGRRVEQA